MNLIFKMLMAMIALLVMPSEQQSIMIDPTGDVQFGGMSYHKPGLKVRMTQALSDLIKVNLLQYGVSYVNWDLSIP